MEYPRLVYDNNVADIEFINIEKIVPATGNTYIKMFEGSDYEVRTEGNFRGLALFLDDNYNYAIGRDDLNYLVLVRIRK